MVKEIKRKGKPLGVKPRQTNNVRDDEPVVKREMTIKQRIIINWMNKAALLALTPSSKKYKEAQLEYVVDLSSKMGKQFPQDVLDCALAKKDIATLLRSSDETKS